MSTCDGSFNGSLGFSGVVPMLTTEITEFTEKKPTKISVFFVRSVVKRRFTPLNPEEPI
jgi:hypothetical protein